jgi:hypothetical protein
MNELDPELLSKIKSFGYSVYQTNEELIITSRNSTSIVLSVISIISGMILLSFSADGKLALMAILLIFVPIVTFRRNSKKTIKIHPPFIEFRSDFFTKIKQRSLADIKNVILQESERDSYTSAFVEGHKDYFLTISLLFRDSVKIELFHFIARNRKKFDFAEKLIVFLETLIKSKPENPN